MSYHLCVFLGLKSSCCQRCCLFSSVIHTLYSWSGGLAGNKISATQTTRGFNWDKIVAREQKSDSASCILIHCEIRICCMWKKAPSLLLKSFFLFKMSEAFLSCLGWLLMLGNVCCSRLSGTHLYYQCDNADWTVTLGGTIEATTSICCFFLTKIKFKKKLKLKKTLFCLEAGYF